MVAHSANSQCLCYVYVLSVLNRPLEQRWRFIAVIMPWPFSLLFFFWREKRIRGLNDIRDWGLKSSRRWCNDAKQCSHPTLTCNKGCARYCTVNGSQLVTPGSKGEPLRKKRFYKYSDEDTLWWKRYLVVSSCEVQGPITSSPKHSLRYFTAVNRVPNIVNIYRGDSRGFICTLENTNAYMFFPPCAALLWCFYNSFSNSAPFEGGLINSEKKEKRNTENSPVNTRPRQNLNQNACSKTAG